MAFSSWRRPGVIPAATGVAACCCLLDKLLGSSDQASHGSLSPLFSHFCAAARQAKEEDIDTKKEQTPLHSGGAPGGSCAAPSAPSPSLARKAANALLYVPLKIWDAAVPHDLDAVVVGSRARNVVKQEPAAPGSTPAGSVGTPGAPCAAPCAEAAPETISPTGPSLHEPVFLASGLLSDLAACLLALPAGGTIDLGGRVFSSSGADGPAPPVLLAITRAGITVRNGTICLTHDQRVEVSGAGGVCFEGVEIVDRTEKGAARSGSVVTIRDGSSLLLRRCVLFGGPGTAGALVCAKGGSSLELDASTVTSAFHSCCGCSISGASRLKAQGSTISGGKRLLKVRSGSTAHLAACTFSGAAGQQAAVLAADSGTHIWADECQWGSGAATGLRVQDGGRATLRACSVAASAEGHGACITGAGSVLTATSSRFCDNKLQNLLVLAGACALLEHCHLSGSTSTGGLCVSGSGSTVSAVDCESVENKEAGALVEDGGAAVLLRCKLNAPACCANLEVRGAGSSGTARDCQMVASPQVAVYVHGGGHALLHRSAVTGLLPHVGLVQGEGSRLQVLLCPSLVNPAVRFRSGAGGTLEIDGVQMPEGSPLDKLI